MSFSFVGPAGSAEHRWIAYALLRDAVQHHIEGGKPTPEHAELHRVAEALGGKSIEIPAGRLRAQVQRAKQVLAEKSVAELAVSARTRSVLLYEWPPPADRQTWLLSECGVSLPVLTGHEKTLDDVVGALLDDLLRITEGASDTDVVHVFDL